MPKQVGAFLESHPDANVESPALKVNGVQCVARIERMPAQKTIVCPGWRSRSRNGSLAAICLQKKDERLHHYRNVNGDYFKEYWLAIASLGPGTVEDGGFEMLLERNFVTGFDRVHDRRLDLRSHDSSIFRMTATQRRCLGEPTRVIPASLMGHVAARIRGTQRRIERVWQDLRANVTRHHRCRTMAVLLDASRT